MTSNRSYFFAGGGTGGHIYPAIAVAEQLKISQPDSKILFFCSSRNIDSRIFSKAGFEFCPLPAKPFSIRPDRFFAFCLSFLKSYRLAKQIVSSGIEPVVIGVGGFASAPVVLAAKRLRVPVAILNVDIVPGKANKLLACLAKKIFVQFAETAAYFRKEKVAVTGCPLRNGFQNPDPAAAINSLGLAKNKKILLITGASSGSESINKTMLLLLDKLAEFKDHWQIVHLAGLTNFQAVKQSAQNAPISYKVIDYYDDMPNLLAASSLVIGRAGAVSVAEYAAAGVPAVCMPYPHHKDRHQYLNAGKLVHAGCAVIVDDTPDIANNAERLGEVLIPLMRNDQKRGTMKLACEAVRTLTASKTIATALSHL